MGQLIPSRSSYLIAWIKNGLRLHINWPDISSFIAWDSNPRLAKHEMPLFSNRNRCLCNCILFKTIQIFTFQEISGRGSTSKWRTPPAFEQVRKCCRIPKNLLKCCIFLSFLYCIQIVLTQSKEMLHLFDLKYGWYTFCMS